MTPSEEQLGDITLPPNAQQLINALRQIGYSFEQAISDLVDNCVNAKARHVVIRLIHNDEAVMRALVVDNGYGMTQGLLDKAMRFGAHESDGVLSLGKFGMGMKLASFSHAQTLSVHTSSGGVRAGRRWTVEGVANNWMCQSIPPSQTFKIMADSYADLDVTRSGTVIEWSRIDRLSKSKNGVEATVAQLLNRLKTHLGLHFHRFLERKSLQITLDSVHEQESVVTRHMKVLPLNPFAYPESGHADFPKIFSIDMPSVGVIKATAHIWPPNSKSAEYSLGNRAASRQGFYFYRNERLIQAGGWNGVVEHETEPHTSLARISIELPESLDESFGLNVQKSLVNVPPSFPSSVNSAVSDDTKFSEYRSLAQKVYRKQDVRAKEELPLSPTGALPAEVIAAAKEALGGGKRVRNVSVRWGDSDGSGDLFRIDRENLEIILDKRLRKPLLGGRKATATDLPVLKLLFFFLLEEDLDRSRQSAARKEKLERINNLLTMALRQERKTEA